MIHHLHLFLHHINVALPVRTPQNHNNRQTCHQRSNMITRKHKFSNLHWISNQQYSFELFKKTEANQLRRSTRSNLGQKFPTYAQEYDLVTTIPVEIMVINIKTCRKPKFLPRPQCLIQILCILTRKWSKMMLHSFKRHRTRNFRNCQVRRFLNR